MTPNVPSVLWLGIRNSTRPVKMSDEVLVWLSLYCGANDLHMVQLIPQPPDHLLLY